MSLSDVAFAARIAGDLALQEAIGAWLRAEASRPDHVEAEDWLSFEQDKHQKLLAAVA